MKLFNHKTKLIIRSKFGLLNGSQTGQVLIVLLLTTLVVLTIGLAVTVRSLNDLTTSTRNDQSQRAFSAAEAGIEKYLASPAIVSGRQSVIPFSNNSSFEVDANINVPPPASPAQPQPALEYPPIGKDTIAQFWIVNPQDVSTVPTMYFNGSLMTLYFGNPNQTIGPLDPNAPAVEVNVITYNSSTNQYGSKRYFIDSYSRTSTTTGFTNATCNSNVKTLTTSSLSSVDERFFACSHQINLSTGGACVGSCFPIIVRIRLLYSNVNQRIALKLQAGGSGLGLPRQAEIYYSKGISGQTQQILKAFKIPKVIPNFLDFAVFSIGSITK